MKSKKKEQGESQSDTQGGDEPIIMEGQEDEETSRGVNEVRGEPDGSNEKVDERID